MEIAIIVVIAVVLLLVAMGSPTLRRQREHEDAAARLHYDVDHEFKRPPNEGNLL
jgi:hypothetical protein